MNTWKSAVSAGMTAVLASATPVKTPEKTQESPYQRLGGMPAIRAVEDDLVARILADGRVNAWFSHAASDPANAAAYKAKLADFTASHGRGSVRGGRGAVTACRSVKGPLSRPLA